MLQPPSRLPRSTSTASLSRRRSVGAAPPPTPGNDDLPVPVQRKLPVVALPTLRGLNRSNSTLKLKSKSASSPAGPGKTCVPSSVGKLNKPPVRAPASSVSSTSTTSGSTTTTASASTRHPPIPRAQGLRHMSSVAGLRAPAPSKTTSTPTPVKTTRTALPSTTTPASKSRILRPQLSQQRLIRKRSAGSIATGKRVQLENMTSVPPVSTEDHQSAPERSTKGGTTASRDAGASPGNARKIDARPVRTLPPALGGAKRLPLRSPFVESRTLATRSRRPVSNSDAIFGPASSTKSKRASLTTEPAIPSVRVSQNDPSPARLPVASCAAVGAENSAPVTEPPSTLLSPKALASQPTTPLSSPMSHKLTPPSSPRKPPSSPVVFSPSSDGASSPAASSTPSPRKTNSWRSMAPSPSPCKLLLPSPQPPSPATSALSTTSTVPPFSARRRLFEAPGRTEPTTPRRSLRAPLPDTPGLSSYLKDNSARIGYIKEGDVSLASSGSFSQMTPPGFVFTDGESSPSPSPPRRATGMGVRGTHHGSAVLGSPLSPFSPGSPSSPSPLSARGTSTRPMSATTKLRSELERVKNERAALVAKVEALESERGRLTSLAEAALHDRERALAATDAANLAHEAALWDSVVQAATEAIAEEQALKSTIAAARTLVSAM